MAEITAWMISRTRKSWSWFSPATTAPRPRPTRKRIKRLAEDYRDKDAALVAVSPNDPLAVRLDELGYSDMGDSFEDMKIRAEDKQFNFPYLYDGETQEVSRAYGPVATPHVFIFGRQRKLSYNGRVDDSENPARITSSDAAKAIEALLAGKPVPVEKTKSFGCSIKWADKRGPAKKALERWAAEEVSVEMIDEGGIRALIANDTENLRLVNVWATWCGPCVVEFPELVAINRMYRNREFETVTISADFPDNKAKVLTFLKKQQASCSNYLFDSENKYKLLEAVDPEWAGPLPYTLLIEPGGKIIFRHAGAIDPLEVKKAVVGHLGRFYF